MYVATTTATIRYYRDSWETVSESMTFEDLSEALEFSPDFRAYAEYARRTEITLLNGGGQGPALYVDKDGSLMGSWLHRHAPFELLLLRQEAAEAPDQWPGARFEGLTV